MTKIKKEKDNPKEIKTKASPNRNKFIALGVIAAIIAGVAYATYRSDSTVDTNFASIGGIPCETQEYTTYHIHAHLDIFVNGQHTQVPAQIGLENTCLYWLHTHTPDGIVHMESPKERDFTLGEFFDIWKATGSGFPTATNGPEIFVNGVLVSTDLSSTKMNAHDEIVLVYGDVPQGMPTFYQFPEGD
ncbi:conserved exported protein of unknown function [Nitrosotalea devaniterrae]|uniref:Uncharacterized protein n=1 Tax=Nitrosotalea devaniterrae TaxID=1078905 RepID=A0A128A4E2_9ARCH|nr:conserved exported protein of unknown function [Candidatus Nitrosotalea devanaterra]